MVFMRRHHKTSATLLLLAISLCTLACHVWQHHVERFGIVFEKIRTEHHASGDVIIGKLRNPQVVNNVKFKDWIHLNPDGTIRAGYIGEDTTLNRIPLPVDTWVEFAAPGIPRSCAFPYDIEVDGHVVSGSRLGSEGVRTEFYPSGRLRLFYSPKDVLIDGILCKGSLFHSIVLDESGNLLECTLASPAEINGKSYAKNSRISVRELEQ